MFMGRALTQNTHNFWTDAIIASVGIAAPDDGNHYALPDIENASEQRPSVSILTSWRKSEVPQSALPGVSPTFHFSAVFKPCPSGAE